MFYGLYPGPLLDASESGPCSAFSLVGADLWLVVIMSDWPVSLVTHVSSNHRCWYFHQPRPLRASPAWTQAQHSLGAKNKELFLAHLHVLHKSAQTKMRKDNAQLSHIFPTWRVPWSTRVPHWHSQGQGQLSVSCPGSPGSSSAPRGKTDPSLGSCPNLFLGYVFARLASARTPLPSSHQPSSWFLTHTAPSSLRWKRVSCQHFLRLLAPGLLVMPRNAWIMPYIERWWEFQRMAIRGGIFSG